MYDIFRTIRTRKEFFAQLDSDKLKALTPKIMDEMYNIYFTKCVVFQEANFECENKDCEKIDEELTLHHIKFQKNKGKTSKKNGACICGTCHRYYHSGRISLTIRGATYQLHKDDEIDWKQVRFETKKIRKSNKEYYGYNITWELMKELMKFLNVEYSDYDDVLGIEVKDD